MDDKKKIKTESSKIKKENPFIVPEAYFDNFSSRLHDKIHASEAPGFYEKYVLAVRPYLAIAAFFDLIIVLLVIGRQAAGSPKIVPFTWLGLLGLKLVFVFLLAGFGLMGIAIAVLISESFTAVVTYFYIQKEIQVGKFWIKLFIPMIIVLAIGLASTLLGLDLILAVILCIVSVIFTIFVGLRLRVLSTADMSIIQSVVSPKFKWVMELILRIGGYPREDVPDPEKSD